MKRLLPHFFTLSVFLLAVSFSLQTFAGNPQIRKYAQGGGGGIHPCIPDDGTSHTLHFEVYFESYDMSFLHSCDLYVGWNFPESGENYLAISPSGFTPSTIHLGQMVQPFTVTLSAGDIAAMCDQQDFIINLDLYCADFDLMESITNGQGFDFNIDLCCAHRPEFDTTEDNNPYTFDIKSKTENNSIQEKVPYTDYLIYDMHGNQIVKLRDITHNLSVQEYISKLEIDTGIYFIRFWDGKKVTTTKIFKL